MMNFMDNDKGREDGMTFDEFLTELINGVKQIDRNLDCSGVLKASGQLKESQIKGEDENKKTLADERIERIEHEILKCTTKNQEQQFYKGDMVEILEEPFVGVQGKIVDEVKLMDKFLVKIGDINSLYVDKDKVKLVKKKLVITKKEFEKWVMGDLVKVTIRNRRTTVKLPSGVESSVYCHENDEYNEELAIKLAYNKARRKDLDKEYEELLDEIESKEIKSESKKDDIIGKKANVYDNGKLIAEGIIEEGTYFKYSVKYTKNFEDDRTLRCGFNELNKPFVGLVVTLAE